MKRILAAALLCYLSQALDAAKLHIKAPCNSVLNAVMIGLPAVGFGVESSDRVGGFLKFAWTKGTSSGLAVTRDIKALTALKGFWATAGYDIFKVEGASLTAIPSGGGCDAIMRISYAGYKKYNGWFVLPSNDSFETSVLGEIAKYVPKQDAQSTIPESTQGDRSEAAAGPTPRTEAPQPARPTDLRITSEPTGAEISMDGAYQGSTPLQTSPADGEHAIKITKRGFVSWERKLNVKLGDVRTIHADLEPAPVDPSKPKIIGLQ